eukprot:jgi/Bigna1/67652/fgenesh1_pg.4_\
MPEEDEEDGEEGVGGPVSARASEGGDQKEAPNSTEQRWEGRSTTKRKEKKRKKKKKEKKKSKQKENKKKKKERKRKQRSKKECGEEDGNDRRRRKRRQDSPQSEKGNKEHEPNVSRHEVESTIFRALAWSIRSGGPLLTLKKFSDGLPAPGLLSSLVSQYVAKMYDRHQRKAFLLESRDPAGLCLLDHACQTGRLEHCKWLIEEQGADPRAPCPVDYGHCNTPVEEDKNDDDDGDDHHQHRWRPLHHAVANKQAVVAAATTTNDDVVAAAAATTTTTTTGNRIIAEDDGQATRSGIEEAVGDMEREELGSSNHPKKQEQQDRQHKHHQTMMTPESMGLETLLRTAHEIREEEEERKIEEVRQEWERFEKMRQDEEDKAFEAKLARAAAADWNDSYRGAKAAADEDDYRDHMTPEEWTAFIKMQRRHNSYRGGGEASHEDKGGKHESSSHQKANGDDHRDDNNSGDETADPPPFAWNRCYVNTPLSSKYEVFAAFEARFAQFESDASGKEKLSIENLLPLKDMVFPSEDGGYFEGLTAALRATPPQQAKRIIRTLFLKWHPDKFMGKYRAKLQTEEAVKTVLERVTAVQQSLVAIKEKMKL